MVKTFMNYPGNKSRLLKQLLPLVPSEYNVYFEPFVGSGAMFLALEPSEAIINDINEDVINIWKHVQKNPLGLIEDLSEIYVIYENNTDTVRWARDLLANIHLYKNRHVLYLFFIIISFRASVPVVNNGYYFLGFSKSIKDYAKKLYNTYKNIKSVSNVISKVKMYNKDYKMVINYAKKGDFVYLDPPYIYDTKNPMIYNTKGEENIISELKNQMGILTSRNVYVMLSNSDYPIVRETFKDYNVHTIEVYRPSKRKYVTELVITNYE